MQWAHIISGIIIITIRILGGDGAVILGRILI